MSVILCPFDVCIILWRGYNINIIETQEKTMTTFKVGDRVKNTADSRTHPNVTGTIIQVHCEDLILVRTDKEHGDEQLWCSHDRLTKINQ